MRYGSVIRSMLVIQSAFTTSLSEPEKKNVSKEDMPNLFIWYSGESFQWIIQRQSRYLWHSLMGDHALHSICHNFQFTMKTIIEKKIHLIHLQSDLRPEWGKIKTLFGRQLEWTLHLLNCMQYGNFLWFQVSKPFYECRRRCSFSFAKNCRAINEGNRSALFASPWICFFVCVLPCAVHWEA